MNASTIAGILRTLLACAAGYLGGKGIDITGLMSPESTAAIGTVIVALWSVWSKKTPPPAAA
tara:strand:+ start:715 stop:900 length:186 start_codon:yes stop_codon:yes gene_type:complete